MKVKLVYRNYKPIHKIYESLVESPPEGVSYVVPAVKTGLNRLFPLYRKIRYVPLGKQLIREFEKRVFIDDNHDVDIVQYVNMIADKPPSMPYVVDLEHVAGLMSFSPATQSRTEKVLDFLQNPKCKAIDCMSEAAKETLKALLEEDYNLIAHKTHIIYPALTPLDKSYLADYSHLLKNPQSIQLLFVGNQAYVKGFDELLAAIKVINKKFSEKAITLYAITDDGNSIAEKYNLPNVKLYTPNFNKYEIFTKFYMPADALVMPTKQDTFGMALLDALNCGTAVISTKQFAIPEIVSEGVDGLLVKFSNPMLSTTIIPSKKDTKSVTRPNLNNEIVQGLIKIIEDIINKKIDLEIMGQKARKKFEPGNKFSVDVRNDKLQNIYKQAIN